MDELRQLEHAEPVRLAGESMELYRKIRSLTQEVKNASRSTGSRKSAGGGLKYDAFDAGWGDF